MPGYPMLPKIRNLKMGDQINVSRYSADGVLQKMVVTTVPQTMSAITYVYKLALDLPDGTYIAIERNNKIDMYRIYDTADGKEVRFRPNFKPWTWRTEKEKDAALIREGYFVLEADD